MKGENNLAFLFLVVVLMAGLFFLYSVSAVEPNGANIGTPIRSERASSGSPGNNSAEAGNITEITISGFSTTSAWQGYIGNVSGTIRLADASGDVLYNWSLASPSGEIYASRNQTIQWTNIQCFNFTATGTLAGGETPGGTSLYGLNLTTLESSYGIEAGDVDGVNETFSDANSHAAFFSANREFSAGECVSTDLFDSSGAAVDGNFEEVLLYEPTTTSVIFASLLEKDLAGFDSNSYDFQMLVLEDGHNSQALTSTLYYFFVELE